MSFDTLAPHYRWMEAVLAGSLLQRCRTRFLHDVRHAKHALIVGPGRGRFVQALLAVSPATRLTLVDNSSEMLARLEHDLARSHPRWHERVRLVHADILEWDGPASAVDAVATHFVLDCFEPPELARVVTRVTGWTTHEARWLVSDFRIPPNGWRRHRARVIHALMYAFFREFTAIRARSVTRPDGLLQEAGFSLVSRKTFNAGLLHADLWLRNAVPANTPASTSPP